MNDRVSLASVPYEPAVARHAGQDMATEPGPQHIAKWYVALGTSLRRTIASG